MRCGWFNEQYRHSLAARGIKTSFKLRSYKKEMLNLPRAQTEKRRFVHALKENKELKAKLERKRATQIKDSGEKGEIERIRVIGLSKEDAIKEADELTKDLASRRIFSLSDEDIVKLKEEDKGKEEEV